MRDNEIIIMVRAAVLARLTVRGIVAELKQAQQPTPQGIPLSACIFMHKILDRRYGYPQEKEQWNETTQEFDYVTGVSMESTFQFTAICPQDPAAVTALTTADILKETAAALQFPPLARGLRALGLGVLRITDVRNVYSIDDRDQHQANPSFDVIFTHRDETIDSVQPINTYEININRV